MRIVQIFERGVWKFAMKDIREGRMVLDMQLDVGCELSSGLRDAFSKIMGAAPTNIDKHLIVLKAAWIDTPLGSMLAIADEEALYLLEFVDRRGLEREIERLCSKIKAAIIPGHTSIIASITTELASYFDGSLKEFKTPVHFFGTPFQKNVWLELMRIPYGHTRTYSSQASAIGRSKAYRAVANANGANQIAIVIPCHRIINSNQELGGYSGGLSRKKWLITHESQRREKDE